MISHHKLFTLFPYTTLFRSWAPYGFLEDCDLSKMIRVAPCASSPCRKKSHIAWTEPALFAFRSEEHTSELQSHSDLVCRLLLEKKIIYKDIFLVSDMCNPNS